MAQRKVRPSPKSKPLRYGYWRTGSKTSRLRTNPLSLPIHEPLASAKASRVFRALLRIGWVPKEKKGGSHLQLVRPEWPEYTWAFHDSDEIGPVMMSKIAKHTGLRPEDL
ncbi:MAG: type II toxin-antitoxin system HicA family toxin [Acidobacteriales bacterium]|nr:type II toxin-antitoxin system HicA family toxin [Terriglobales bacterium]